MEEEESFRTISSSTVIKQFYSSGSRRVEEDDVDTSKNDMDNNRTEKRNSVDDLARKDDLFSFLIRGKMTWIRGITRKGVILHISCLFGDADFINNTAVINYWIEWEPFGDCRRKRWGQECGSNYCIREK